MEGFLAQFVKLFPELNLALGSGILIFARIAGLFRFAPVISRKEVPVMVRTAFGLIFAVILTMHLKPAPPPPHTSLILCIILNFIFGSIIGYIASCVLMAIMAGGDMINTQMGMSSATVLDPTTQQQTSVLGNYFTFLGWIVFIAAGGMYWLFDAFIRSFHVFPIYSNSLDLANIISIDYITLLTSNILFMGMQIAAPVLLATLGQDIILGIISKTAPQVNVFQLSFLFKPILGSAILVWILPMIVEAINTYVTSYAEIF